jgi:hypothetical protein
MPSSSTFTPVIIATSGNGPEAVVGPALDEVSC